MVKPAITPYQLEHVMMIAACPEIEVLSHLLYNLETTCVDVKISLARQIANAERYV